MKNNKEQHIRLNPGQHEIKCVGGKWVVSNPDDLENAIPNSNFTLSSKNGKNRYIYKLSDRTLFVEFGVYNKWSYSIGTSEGGWTKDGFATANSAVLAGKKALFAYQILTKNPDYLPKYQWIDNGHIQWELYEYDKDYERRDQKLRCVAWICKSGKEFHAGIGDEPDFVIFNNLNNAIIHLEKELKIQHTYGMKYCEYESDTEEYLEELLDEHDKEEKEINELSRKSSHDPSLELWRGDRW